MIQTFKTHLTEKKQLSKDVFLITFKLAEPAEISFKAGQYLMLLCPQEGSYPIRRMYSIASPPSQKDSFELLAEIVPNGVASQYFLRMQLAEEVQFQGPAGMFTFRENTNPKVFLATGTGLAPMRSMWKTYLEKKEIDFHLFWGVPYLHETYFLDEFKTLTETYSNFKAQLCISRETDLSAVESQHKNLFTLGRVTKALEEHSFASNTEYYLCGGRTVVEALRLYLYDKGIPKENVIFEKF